jgi:hypothetical protein
MSAQRRIAKSRVCRHIAGFRANSLTVSGIVSNRLVAQATFCVATTWSRVGLLGAGVDLSRIYAVPVARLGCLALEGQRAFASQC